MRKFREIVHLLKCINGSATLEATIIIPLVTLLMFSTVSLAGLLYHKYSVLNTSIYLAEQCSFIWDDSSRELETGVSKNQNGDGLYWRLFDDFPNSPLAEKKKAAAIHFLTKPAKGTFLPTSSVDQSVSYERGLFARTIRIGIRKKFTVKDIFVSKVNSVVDVGVHSEVVEPTEFIRNCNLGANYLSEFLTIFNQGKSQDTTAEDKKSEVVYASQKSNVNGQKLYHYSGCIYLGQIKSENLITFVSEEEAQQKGYHLCLVCASRDR